MPELWYLQFWYRLWGIALYASHTPLKEHRPHRTKNVSAPTAPAELPWRRDVRAQCRTSPSHLSDGSARPRRPSVGIGTWSHAGRRTVRRHGLVAGLHRASPSTSLDKSAGAGAMDLSISSAPASVILRAASGAEYSTLARPPPRDRRALCLPCRRTSSLRPLWPRRYGPASFACGSLARGTGRRH